MDWNNVFGVEGGGERRSSVAVVSDDGVDVIPFDQSNVVLRSVEEMSGVDGDVEVLQILEGQPMEMREEASMTEDENILGGLKANADVEQVHESGDKEGVVANESEQVEIKDETLAPTEIEVDDQVSVETGDTEQVDSVFLKEESMEIVQLAPTNEEKEIQSSREACDTAAKVKRDEPSTSKICEDVNKVVLLSTKQSDQLESTEDVNKSISSPSSAAIVLDAHTGQPVAILDGQITTLSEETDAVKEPDVICISHDDYGMLNDVDDGNDDVIYISDNEEDEVYKIQFQNARTMLRIKQSVDVTAASYKHRFVSREKLRRKHPRIANLTFREIVNQTVVEDKILPEFNEQVLPRKIADKLRLIGHSIHKPGSGACVVTSKSKNIRMYHSSCSSRFDPVLADPVLENYVQEFRKTILPSRWRKGIFGSMEVDPSSVIPASIGSTGSSSIGSETDPECLATDEEESESELMQASAAAWIIPDSIPSRTPSPVEPDFDEPQFITTTTTTPVGSHTIVEGPPTKKRKQKHHEPQPHTDGKIYPKPAFSYSCLIAMALKNSKTGSLPVSEIYKFMCDHFPYFKSAPSGWKNSVRHNLSLNKCFEKIEKPGNGARKGCLWALNPAKIHKMDEEVQKWSRKDPVAIRKAMSDPENLELIERGELKRDYSGAGASDDDEDEDFSEPATPLTPAQLQARRSRTNSSDSTVEGTTTVVTPVVTTVSQVHAALQRSVDSKSQLQLKREDSVELATITTNIKGNYLCHTPSGNGTYTLSFANIGSSSPLTPIIIRRTPVK